MKTRKGGFSHPPVPPFSYWLRLEFCFLLGTWPAKLAELFFYIYIKSKKKRFYFGEQKKIALFFFTKKKIALFFTF